MDDTCKISPSALALASKRSHAGGVSSSEKAETATGSSKAEAYADATKALDRFFAGYAVDTVGRMSTIVAFLRLYFPRFFFCGFYTVPSPGARMLFIGPYSGNGHVLACGVIPFEKGVCGTAAHEGVTQVVPDVRLLDNYISCDEDTLSEIVVPVFGRNAHNEADVSGDSPRRLIAILDIDADVVGSFDEVDRVSLEAMMARYF
jgi:L-methionine (R)-S-oxide reductase